MASFVFYILFETSTLLLSCIRVYAVWKGSNRVVVIFGLLWMTTVAGCCTIVSGSEMISVQGLCLEYLAHPYLAAVVILPTANHCIVFLAITVGLCRNHGSSSIKLYVLGDALPAFSKAFLQSSQICYVIAAISGITNVIWFYACDFDSRYRLALIPFYTAVVNIMYSWVFRKGKQGIFTIIPKPIDPTIFNSVELGPTRHGPFPQPKTSNNIHYLAPSKSSSVHTSEGVDHGHRYGMEASTPVKIGVEKVVLYENDQSAVERGI
ncbi:hypothetical protein CPC08DRAFT_725197 [Agrocybe pediades]|nr:hypothetical protein CPC08DRAFT_725197 [Agrocybe pediades]